MFTGFAPIKPLPSIKEVVAQTQTLAQQPVAPVMDEKQEAAAVKKEEAANTASPQQEEQLKEQPEQPKANPEPDAEAQPEGQTENFTECWKQMVDSIFQKNQLEMSKRAMLEYWRNHFHLNVDDIEFVIREHERKKVIYTSEDKVNNMLEQNPELKDFLQVLNFRIKD